MDKSYIEKNETF